MTLWDEVAAEVLARHPNVTSRSVHVDALAARFVGHPAELDVVVGSNLFGDILSDVGAAIVGSLGMAPSANLNPERRHPAMFVVCTARRPTSRGGASRTPSRRSGRRR